jgi:FAD synthetase
MPTRKPTVVLASGVFDLIHYGHIQYLREAKKAGGPKARLVVIIARDQTVERLKGTHPVLPEKQRRAVVESLKPVDEAILGLEDLSFSAVIERVQPDVIAVGYDQRAIEDAVRSAITRAGKRVRVVRIRQFDQSSLDSSSKIKRKIIAELQDDR